MTTTPHGSPIPPAIVNSGEARDCLCGHRHWFRLDDGQPEKCTDPACGCTNFRASPPVGGATRELATCQHQMRIHNYTTPTGWEEGICGNPLPCSLHGADAPEEATDARLLEAIQDGLLHGSWKGDLPPAAIDATLAALARFDSLRARVSEEQNDRERARRVHLDRHTRLSEAVGLPPGYSADATVDAAIKQLTTERAARVLAEQEGLALEQENARLRADALNFARSIATNYDHDTDAHRYNTVCRVCSAEDFLADHRPEPPA